MANIPRRAIGNLTITSTDIVDGTISASDIGSGAVGSAAIASNAVDASKIVDNSITAGDIAAAALPTFKGVDKRYDFVGVLAVSADAGRVSNTGLPETPLAGSIVLNINTVEQKVGDGVKTTDAYFSSDSGVTAKTHATIATGDLLYLNAVIANMTTLANDSVFIRYRV